MVRSLNPCCYGIEIELIRLSSMRQVDLCFNPCCYGIEIEPMVGLRGRLDGRVLILVVME